MLLVELHAKVPLEERREPEGLESQQLRRDARVEDVRDAPAIILVEQSQVVVSVVKHDLDRGVLEQLAEDRRLADRQRVDDRVAGACRQLQQIDAVDEPVEACSFGVERQLAGLSDRLEVPRYRLGRIEVHCSAAICGSGHELSGRENAAVAGPYDCCEERAIVPLPEMPATWVTVPRRPRKAPTI
jgi:hypothetical protein